MKNIAIIILSIILFACKQNNREIDEQQLLGTWETIEGFDFEEITFSVDDDERIVDLVFGQKASVGSWKIQDNNLIVEGPYDTLTFTDVQFIADTLILVQKNGVNSVFIRLADSKCDAKEMLQSLKNISKVEFSEIADTILEDDTKAYYMYIPVNVKGDFSALGKAIAPLVNELPNSGFELDNELITEIQTGYFFENYKLIVTNQFISPLPNSEEELTENKDESGIYKAIIICYCQ
ncbi:hypothetical protein CYCD_05290 [Tenuifilaceae bacterium CYCD]|nr:hypothetical protein CYCD_05290 [Tenuifilaceae bacterium CYCD]